MQRWSRYRENISQPKNNKLTIFLLPSWTPGELAEQLENLQFELSESWRHCTLLVWLEASCNAWKKFQSSHSCHLCDEIKWIMRKTFHREKKKVNKRRQKRYFCKRICKMNNIVNAYMQLSLLYRKGQQICRQKINLHRRPFSIQNKGSNRARAKKNRKGKHTSIEEKGALIRRRI